MWIPICGWIRLSTGPFRHDATCYRPARNMRSSLSLRARPCLIESSAPPRGSSEEMRSGSGNFRYTLRHRRASARWAPAKCVLPPSLRSSRSLGANKHCERASPVAESDPPGVGRHSFLDSQTAMHVLVSVRIQRRDAPDKFLLAHCSLKLSERRSRVAIPVSERRPLSRRRTPAAFG